MTTIARPYVAAAFEYASAKQELPAWESMLQAAASLTLDPSVARLLQNPNATKQQLADIFCEILKPQLSLERTNFIRLLAENGRLTLLPEIAELFGTFRAAEEQTITVQVVSATELDSVYQQKLVEALKKRLQRQVKLQNTVDESLLGGIIVRAGDMVVDGSIRGKLTRLIDFI